MTEKKDEGVLAMVITSGLFIIGKLIGGNKLTKPRVFMIIEDGKKIQMSPLPGTPPFLRIGLDVSSYTMPMTELNKNITDLYSKVTDPTVDPG